MKASGAAFEKLALEEPNGLLELYCGEVRRKPSMTSKHNDYMLELGYSLRHQLPRDRFRVRVNAGHARRSARNYFVPDVLVVPFEMAAPLLPRSDVLEAYSDPLPLIVEIWSPSTGRYDARDKLPEYRRRGDLEIWFIHPYERTLTAWRRQPDGTYSESVYRGGVIQPVALPNISIDLDALFE